MRINGGLQVNNFSVSLYDIEGHFLNKFNMGEVNYTLEDFNEFSLSIFNKYIPSGIYILAFNMDEKIKTKKIIYLK